MKSTARNFCLGTATVCLELAVALTGCSSVSNSKVSQYEEAERIANADLATFDTLDFDVYTHQKWDRLKESHAQDILVHYPDGHTSKGLDAHIGVASDN